VPAGDVSYWQAAIRTPDDSQRAAIVEAIETHQGVTIDLLYGDQEGGQRTITRFQAGHIPGDDCDWACWVTRHWNLDRDDPR
jgi:hypothetical protein